MAKRTKKLKPEAHIKNDERESATDFIVKEGGDDYHVKSAEVESKTKLEDDKGHGDSITIRAFTFGANPESFRIHKPSAQDLFNAHLKQIEVELWKDGWTMYTEVEPRIVFSTNGKDFESYSPIGKQYTHYQFFIAAKPSRGSLLKEKPNTLTELIHGDSTKNS